MKKYMAWLLLVVILFSFCACTGVPDNGDKDSVSESESDSQGSNDAVKDGEFLISELSAYKVVYKSGISLNTLKKVRDLQTAIEEKYGVEIDSSSDTAKVGETEILIGKTNRPESKTAASDAKRIDDYAISIVGKKIALTAYTEEKLVEGIDKLIAAIKGVSDEKSFFGSAQETAVLGSYTKDSVSVSGNELFEYTIVHADSDEGRALGELARDMISEKSGYVLDMSATPTEGKQIFVGKTSKGAPAGMTSPNAADRYYMGTVEGDLYLYGADLVSAYKAVDALGALIGKATGKVVDIDANKGTVSSPDTSMTAMTFNVLCDRASDTRVSHVIDMIKKHKPDTFGVQEATERWMTALDNALGSEYSYVGIARNGDTNDEYSAVFYKKSKFNLVESGTKWLSDTPDVAGSKYPDSQYIRIFTYAVLENKSTGDRFVHINTHIDTAASARLKQVKVIVDFLKNSSYANLPVILTGDMNELITADAMQYLLSAGFENSADKALISDDSYTFGTKIIDFLLVKKDKLTVYSYDVDTYKYGDRDPSDHCPAIIRYDIKK